MKINASARLWFAVLELNTPFKSDRTAPLRAENLIRDLYPREETKTKRTPWRTDEENIQRANAKRRRKGAA